MHQSLKTRDQFRICLKSISTIYLLQIGLKHHWWNIHPPSCPSFVTLNFCKATLVGSRSSERYINQRFKSRDQFRAWLKSLSGIDFVQSGQDRHWWNIHPPSCPRFAKLSSCKSTLVGSSSSKRYFHQCLKSRDQSGTRLKSISAVYLLQFDQDRDWWIFHPPSCSRFVTLNFCKSTRVGSRSLWRYLYQSLKYRYQSGILLKSISSIYFLQIGMDHHWWNIHLSCSSFTALSCYKSSLFGFTSSWRYLHQRMKSRDQSETWLKSISCST